MFIGTSSDSDPVYRAILVVPDNGVMLSHFIGLDIEPNLIILHRHGLYTYPVESS